MYDYDGDGTRIKKRQGTTVTKYVNDVGLPLVQVLAEKVVRHVYYEA
jgi:hypothetical protein